MINKNEYEGLINSTLSEEEFTILLILIPVFSIAHSDGNYDAKEEEVMSLITSNILNEVYSELNTKENKSLTNTYLEDLKVILEYPTLEHDLLEALKSKCEQIDGLANQITKFMEEIASASDGIGKEEQNKMDQINTFLSK